MALEPAFRTAEIPENCTTVEAALTKVTVTENQADVQRETEITFDTGPVNIFITPVTPYLVDSTLWAEVIPEDGVRPDIGSIRCIRWPVPTHADNREVESMLGNALEELCQKITALYQRKERLRWKHRGFCTAVVPAIRSVVEEISLSGIMPEKYEPMLQSIVKNVKDMFIEDFSQMRALAEYEKEVERLNKEWILNRLNRMVFRTQAGILISMGTKSSGKGIVRCGYQVPCAQWRPQHEAHLQSDDKVLFITHGVVWQNTGENWNGVTLTLSTAKPSLGLDAVLPGEDILQLREKTREERRHIQVQARDQVIQTAGVGEAGPGEPPLPSDGGETQLYLVPEKVNIEANGHPTLIKMDQFSMDAETALCATPEIDSHVFLISQVVNPQKRPVLAGPVTLLRGGTFIGTGQIEFVGSNEPFHLWWGSEDLLRIERFVDEKEEDATLFQGRRLSYTVKIYVRNLSRTPSAFRIQERIPVSELEQVKVKLTKPPEKSTSPDENGFIFIDVEIGGSEEKVYELTYTLELDREVEYR